MVIIPHPHPRLRQNRGAPRLRAAPPGGPAPSVGVSPLWAGAVRCPGAPSRGGGRPGSLASSALPAQPGVEEGVEADPQGGHPEGNDGVDAVDEEREQDEPREQGGPGPQDEHASPVAVAEAQQPVVDVVLVGGVEPGPSAVRRMKAKAMSTRGTPRMKKGMNSGAKKK